MCKTKCVCGFPSVGVSEHKIWLSKKVKPYIYSLSQETIDSIKLFRRLLTITYQEKYDGLMVDNSCQCNSPHCQEDLSIHASVGTWLIGMVKKGKIITTWKIFKRRIDQKMSPTISCDICCEEWENNEKCKIGFTSCNTCGKSICLDCDSRLEEPICPFCRSVNTDY